LKFVKTRFFSDPGVVMPISLTCSCGKSFRLKDELAGRKIRCPECTSIQTVPRPPVPEMESLDVLEEIPSERVRATPPPLPFADKVDRLRPAQSLRQEERFEVEEIKKEAKRRRRHEKAVANQRRISTSQASIGGGIAMIVVAIVWFICGLAFNYIFFYPPILLVLGIVALVKGAIGQE